MTPPQRRSDGGQELTPQSGSSPGDALVVFSDGLVETEERTLGLGDLIEELEASVGAEEIVRRLMATTAAKPADDVTVVVLRRLPEVGAHP